MSFDRLQEQGYTGTDISSLLVEIQKAQDVLNKIKEMRQGMLGTALISVMNEVHFITYLLIYLLHIYMLGFIYF